jgi:hypothetical protein
MAREKILNHREHRESQRKSKKRLTQGREDAKAQREKNKKSVTQRRRGSEQQRKQDLTTHILCKTLSSLFNTTSALSAFSAVQYLFSVFLRVLCGSISFLLLPVS